MPWPVEDVPYAITELLESVSFTPSVTNLTIGAGGTLLGFRWRVGKLMIVAIHAVLGTGGNVSGDLGFTVPNGESIDNTFFGVDPAALNLEILSVGAGSAMIGNSFHIGSANIVDATTLEVRSPGVGNLWGLNQPGNWSDNDAFHVNYRIPIEGWLVNQPEPN